MTDEHILKGAKIYFGGREICGIETVEITPPQEPIFIGVDLASGPDSTSIHLTGVFSGEFVIPDLLQWLVSNLAEKVQNVAGVTEQEARQNVLNWLGIGDFDLAFGRGVSLTCGLLTGNKLQSVIIDEFGVPETKTSAPVSAPLKNVRSTKDATPWTHKREPWRAHRPKRGKR